MRPPLGERVARRYAAAAARADRLDHAHRRRSPRALTPGHPGLPAAAWASVRLVAVGLVSPVLGAVVVGSAYRHARRVNRLIERYPGIIDAVGAGRAPDYRASRVERAPAAARYFIASDLHRCVPGTVDWPAHQNTTGLYEVALDFYAAGEWGLVENGDVEDFWLVGGSSYGVVYDVFRLLGHAWPGRAGTTLRRTVDREHLRRIVANNASVYARIQEGFHAFGRYHRLVGNHDDVFLDPDLVDALGDVHPGLRVGDFLVLVPEVGPASGVVTHGHHADAWNGPGQSALGKLGTWLGSALLDAPFAGNPGLPEPSDTDTLLGGRLPALLTAVGRLGANRDLYSLDEVRLFDAFRRHAGLPRGTDDHTGPWLLLGHTHLPLHHPVDPATRATWTRYGNSGAGIFHECVTGLEWDGTADPAHPTVRLVAWRYADHDEQPDPAAVVGWDDGRAVVREVLDRVPPGENLVVVDAGPAPFTPVTISPGAPA